MTIPKASPTEQEASLSATLDFVGERLEPSDLLPLVPLKPYRVRRKGDLPTKRPPPPGVKVLPSPAGSCYYSTLSILSSPDINDHVAFCFAALRPRWAEIAALREAQGFRIAITCFFDDDREKALWLLSEENERLSRELDVPVENETNFDVIPRRRR